MRLLDCSVHVWFLYQFYFTFNLQANKETWHVSYICLNQLQVFKCTSLNESIIFPSSEQDSKILQRRANCRRLFCRFLTKLGSQNNVALFYWRIIRVCMIYDMTDWLLHIHRCTWFTHAQLACVTVDICGMTRCILEI